ncbi:hypothetical protein DFQ06_3024 [Algibacter lectus]|uniref:Uncharacterized protein n=1 Tax=Algibacter lectus TaxID=221126 RepID=A0A4R8MAY8_9FLAO|nr:hypothetical protein DFQ06_3024 [Algibacter lectus]
MIKKRIDTNLHYAQYIIARIILVGGIGFLIYSIWTKETGAIIFSSLFVIYVLILLRKVFDKPTEIEFDENYIYFENGNERIELNKVIGVKKNRILYDSNGVESKLKLPNFHFMDKKWTELKELIKSTKTQHSI